MPCQVARSLTSLVERWVAQGPVGEERKPNSKEPKCMIRKVAVQTHLNTTPYILFTSACSGLGKCVNSVFVKGSIIMVYTPKEGNRTTERV